MEYCLPHAVLALLQEEDSPQTPKSYFVRSGTHSTKITLVYTRRKRRDEISNPPSLPSFCSFSSPSSIATRVDTAVFGQTSRTHESPGLLRLQERPASKKFHPIPRSASVTEGRQNIKSGNFCHDDRKSSLGLSRSGKIVRSSFIAASRSQHGSSGTSSGTASSSSTDDYSNIDNLHQQQQKEVFTNNVSSITAIHNDRKRTSLHGQYSLSNPSNGNNGNDAATQASGNTNNNKVEGQLVKGQYANHSESLTPQWKSSPADHDPGVGGCGGRRARSDSHTSRRTCVSTPGRGYGDSARVRGSQDPRTRGFSRAIATTDPRRNSVSPRGGMDVCDNFRTFEYSIDDHNEHLTISHNSTPRSERSSNDHHQHQHEHQHQHQHEEFQSQLHPCYNSDSATHNNATKYNLTVSPQPLIGAGTSCLDPNGSESQSTNAISHTGRNIDKKTVREITRSPRPPTPKVLPVSTPAQNSSHNHRESPAPCHSPSRQSTFEYDDDDNSHLNDHFSPPPTPCLHGCVVSDYAVESFNSSVKLRLGAHVENMMTGRMYSASTPKLCRSTPPPSTIGLNPPTPAMSFTESRPRSTPSPVRGTSTQFN